MTLDITARPLTVLSEEEELFKATISRFACEQISPYVRAMDEAGVFSKDLMAEMFSNRVDGYRNSGRIRRSRRQFFQSVLAIEALAAVDPAAAVIVDVQNTLSNNANSALGHRGTEDTHLPPLATDTSLRMRFRRLVRGLMPSPCTTRGARQDGEFVITGRKMWITNAAEAGLFLVFANANPEAGYKGITCFLVERANPGFQVGRRKTNSAFARHPRAS